MVENEHNLRGAIFIAYQGVGKSSTVEENDGFIDLESSNFKDENGNRHDDWYKTYINIAFDLATQGYGVFVSSHDVIREEIGKRKSLYPNIQIYTILPSEKLKDKWIKRLEDRYNKNPTEKNKIAWLNAKDRFSENIQEMIDDAYYYGIPEIVIDKIDYKLIDYIYSRANL